MPFESVRINWLKNNKRLHLQHGPIDLIIEATGDKEETKLAYKHAIDTFHMVLSELVSELPLLRSPLRKNSRRPVGVIAKRMYDACDCFAETFFITPMAAVAGAVADYILNVMLHERRLHRVYVNNGGDIAVYLRADESIRIGLCTQPQDGDLPVSITLNAGMGVGGVATSGRHGRSLSQGIADSVTVLADNAAIADAAATLIANAINVPDSPRVRRVPAEHLSPDSDLGTRLVTTGVEVLLDNEKLTALQNGRNYAEKLIDEGHIIAVYASLQEATFSVGKILKKQNLERYIAPTNHNTVGVDYA